MKPVKPEEMILRLSNGDSVTVRRRLTYGEHKAAIKRMYRVSENGAPPQIDPLEAPPAIMTAYLLDWTVTDEAGRVIKIRDEPPDVVTAALEALDPDDAAAIFKAIDAHRVAMQAQQDEEKKSLVGVRTS